VELLIGEKMEFKDNDFIQIPGSKNRIMRGFILKNDDSDYPLRVSYVEAVKFIRDLNDDKKKYRLPNSREILKTFYLSEDRKFKKSFEGTSEWLIEIVDNGYVYVNPTGVREDSSYGRLSKLDFAGMGFTFGKAQEKGIIGPYSDWPARWSLHEIGMFPLVRSWDMDGEHPFSNILFRTMSQEQNKSYYFDSTVPINARIVEVNSIQKKAKRD
jgi:hypothetical protein